MSRPNLPDVARAILKAVIVSLGNAGLATSADVSLLLALLDLQDAQMSEALDQFSDAARKVAA